MKKKFTLHLMAAVLICLCSIGTSNAQKVYQLPNPGFEEWEKGVGLTGTVSATMEPVGWNSFKTGKGLAIASNNPATQMTEVVDGNANTFVSIKASKPPFFNVVANGNITTGIITAGSSTPADPSNYNYTVLTSEVNAGNFRQQFDGRPDALKVRLQFIPVTSTANDVAQVSVWIHTNAEFRDPGETDVLGKAIARALINPDATEAKDGWKEFVVPFDYTVGNEGNIPAYILVSATTNKLQGGGSVGDEMRLDDFEMVYYSALTDIKVGGATVAGFSEDVTTYNFEGEAPDVSAISFTQKSKWSNASITSSKEGRVTTISISVKGNDYEVSGNETVYKLVYSNANNDVVDITGIYTGILNIDLSGMGGGSLVAPDQVIITEDGTNKIGLELKNFAFAGMELGDIIIPNIPIIVNNGKTEFTSDKITIELGDGIITADVQAIGAIENGITDLTISVEWGGISIPVAFKGDVVANGLRLSDIKLNGVSVSDGTFNKDVFNYANLSVAGTEELTYTKVDASSKVNVLMDANWLYLYVTDGQKSNRYVLTNAPDPAEGTPIPLKRISFGQNLDGSLTLRNGAEVGGTFVNVAGGIIYNKAIEDANQWIPFGFYTAPSAVKLVKSDGTSSNLDAHLYTYAMQNGEFKQKELDALASRMMIKLKSSADVESLEIIYPEGTSTSGSSMGVMGGYIIWPTMLKTGTFEEAHPNFSSFKAFYKFNGTEFVQVPSSTEVPPMTMYITYDGEGTPATTIAAPDLGLGINGDTKDAQNVYAIEKTVYVKNYTGEVKTYNINGGLVYAGLINNSGSFDLPSGTYIVQTGSKATIVIVK